MNDSNIPGGHPPSYNNPGFSNRGMQAGPPGRGFGFGFERGRGRGFPGGRGPPMGRGPSLRGRGDLFGPPRGRGFFPERDRFGERGGPPMGRGYDQGRGFDHGGARGIPPPPPPNMGNMGNGVPPPPPPRHNQNSGIPPPPMMSMAQRSAPMYRPGGFHNHAPPPHQNQGLPPHHLMRNVPPPPPQQHQILPPLQSPQAGTAQPTFVQQQGYLAQGHQQHMGHQSNVHIHPPAQPHNVQPHTPQHSQAAKPDPTQTAHSQEKIDQAWTEHTAPNSMKYYYNAITQASTYTKPEALTKAATNDGTLTKKRSWAMYTDLSTGKKYYSDGTTTTWEKPEDFVEAIAVVTQVPEAVDDDEPVKKKKKIGRAKTTEFASKSEAIAAFKGLLLAKDIQPITKWNEVVKNCSSDPRWEACEILSQGERKQALAEYQTKRANELRDLERQERMRAKDAFNNLLVTMVPKLAIFNPMTSRFVDVREYLTKDDRFYAVAEESTRETLFLEFCEEVRKRDERQKRTRKREAKENFFAFLREREENGQLSFASTWSSFLAGLSTENKSDPRYQASPVMSESDRELFFSDFVIELQVAEDEKRRRIRDARRRAEKAQREAYREMLSRLATEGTILPSTRWRNIEDLISKNPSYDPVKEQDREAPRELFQEFVDEWDDIYRRDRVLLARLVQPSSTRGINVTTDTAFEEFSKALLDAASPSPEEYHDIRHILNRKEPVSSARLYYGELLALAKGNASVSVRHTSRRRSVRDDSSEDEGEIVEDGEIDDNESTTAAQSKDGEK